MNIENKIVDANPAELKKSSKPKPLLRGHFHQAMFFIMLGGGLILLLQSKSSMQLLGLIIYVFCALTMLGISSLYHRVTWTMAQRAVWKKFDHAGIYLMIAGTFTPVAIMGLGPQSSEKLLWTVWIVALAGILQSVVFTNLPKMVSSVLYLIAGYLILPYLSELLDRIGIMNIVLIASGGAAYSIGAIIYGLKRPVLNPYIFSYHELFHLFVNLGATLHLIAIALIIKGS